jgi:hypothetical protein
MLVGLRTRSSCRSLGRPKSRDLCVSDVYDQHQQERIPRVPVSVRETLSRRSVAESGKSSKHPREFEAMVFCTCQRFEKGSGIRRSFNSAISTRPRNLLF